MKPLLASALAYTAITAGVGRQVLASMSTALAGDPGDPLLTAAILAWNATQAAMERCVVSVPDLLADA